MTQCSVLEHLEKTSTEHFDFAEHKCEREHRAPNFARARAPSALIIDNNSVLKALNSGLQSLCYLMISEFRYFVA
jgi:hypothetical protein